MLDKIEKDVIQFVSEFCKVDKKEVCKDTSINKNIGLDGDDAIEFLKEFSQKFGVDLSRFEYDKYFGPEGFNPFLNLYYLIFNREKLRMESLTIQDLMDMVNQERK